MTGTTCPGRATLRALLDDSIEQTSQERLAGHLERCTDCRGRLDELAWQASVPAGSGGEDPDETRAVIATLDPPRMPGELGRIGNLAVFELIDRGGMGIVFRAEDASLRRPVALKVMRPGLAADPVARERFLREARAAAAVRDEHVVTVHAVEPGRGLPYLILEHVPGRSLQDRLDAEGKLATGEVARIGAQVASGLAAAHELGIVHRDVKPANILIDGRAGRAKLTDFGLAQALGEEPLTLAGHVAGTPDYMAPEQAAGRLVDARADLYALGVVLHVAMKGRPPDPSGRRGARRPLHDLDRLIDRLCSPDPADRPDSARMVARRLEAIAGGVPTPGRRPRRGVLAVLAALCCTLVGSGDLETAHAPPSGGGGGSASPAGPVGRLTPFEVVGVGRFATLDRAIASAPEGATIEILGDGPYPAGPIRLGERALTLRAGAGCHPVVVALPAGSDRPAPWLETEASLGLLGIEIRDGALRPERRMDDHDRRALISVVGGSLRAEKCRFVAGPFRGCLAVRDAPARLSDCRIEAPMGFGVHWSPGPGDGLGLHGGLLDARLALIVSFRDLGADPRSSTIRLDEMTVRAASAFQMIGEPAPRRRGSTDSADVPLRVSSTSTAFDAEHLMVLVAVGSRPRAVLPSSARLAVWLRSRVSWVGLDDRFDVGRGWLSTSTRGRPAEPLIGAPTDTEGWARFWEES